MENKGGTVGVPAVDSNTCAMALERCLKVGMDVFLDANPGHPSSKRFAAKVRGWETGHYILIAVLPGSGTPVVRQGKECVIRFMHEGEVWGFSALFAEEGLNAGFPLIQLYWPKEVARVQVRKHERVALQTPCQVELGDGTSLTGMLGDLSGGGCSLLLQPEIAVGESLNLSFRMPDGGQVARRPVIVRNRRAIPGQGLKYGCQFQFAEEKDHGIQLFVARKIAIDRGESAPHPQILVLSRDESDIERAQQALSGTRYEAIGASGILDLGYQLRTCEAVAILISVDQKALSAIEVLSLIRQSRGVEGMPLFIYGGGHDLKEQALAMGATLCLDGPGDVARILTYLPRQAHGGRDPAPVERPGTAARPDFRESSGGSWQSGTKDASTPRWDDEIQLMDPS